MNSASFIANEDLSNHSTALIKVIEVLKTQFPGAIDDVEISTPTGFHDIQAKKRSQLWDKFNKYILPTYSVSDFSSICESYRLEQFRAHKLRILARERNGDLGPAPVLEDTLSPAELRNIIVEGLVSFGVWPATRVKEEHPLKYVHPIRWRDFENALVRSPLSKTINLYDTVSNILDEAQNRGLDYAQLGQLIGKFIDIYYPHLSNHTASTKDIKVIFGTLLSGLDIGTDITKVQAAMSSFSRTTRTSINETALILANLQCELYQLQTPLEKMSKSRMRAEKQVAKILPNFVEDSCKAEYFKYKQYKNLRNEELSFRNTIDYLCQLESDPKHSLKGVKSFPKSLVAITANKNTVAVFGNQVGGEKKNQNKSNYGSREGSRNSSRNSSFTRSRENSVERTMDVPEEEKTEEVEKESTKKKKLKPRRRSRSTDRKDILCGICLDFCGGPNESRKCKIYPGIIFSKNRCSLCKAFHLEAACAQFAKNEPVQKN